MPSSLCKSSSAYFYQLVLTFAEMTGGAHDVQDGSLKWTRSLPEPRGMQLSTGFQIVVERMDFCGMVVVKASSKASLNMRQPFWSLTDRAELKRALKSEPQASQQGSSHLMHNPCQVEDNHCNYGNFARISIFSMMA